ncbi:hypothetical protein MKW94_022499 [Papaver nudicaule]|uniref:Uncharacterized protein n=1 Tax=Papaver nudicaule TaxID=74823 RepID=A0AA41SID5_PAPNU|nr:hypothetical protein [Papaver nudicaule]
MSKQHFRTQRGSPCKTERAPAQKKIVKRHKYDKNVYPRVSGVVAERRKISCDHERSVIDIDKEDVNNPLAAVEYVQDLYRFYRLSESSIQVRDYMYLQSDIDEGLRMKLVDLMVGAHHRLELAPEILYLAVQIVDRYVSMNPVTRNEFQLLGLSALVLASKYEEDFVPAARPIEEYVAVADGVFSKQQILAMEKSILEKLGWTFSVPTMYQFLIRFIKAAVADKEMENTVFFFGELCLMQYGMLRYPPSLLAASAVYAARCTLEKAPFWDETLKHYTGYSQYQILECAKQLSRFHSKIAGHELRETFRKYLSCERDVVSLLPQAPSLRF